MVENEHVFDRTDVRKVIRLKERYIDGYADFPPRHSVTS